MIREIMEKQSNMIAWLGLLGLGSFGMLLLLSYTGSFKAFFLSGIVTVSLAYIFDKYIDKHEILDSPTEAFIKPYICFVIFVGLAIFFAAPFIDNAGYCGRKSIGAIDTSYLSIEGGNPKWIKDYEVLYEDAGCSSSSTNLNFFVISIFGTLISFIIFLFKYRKTKND
jgi:hypothetical protein